MIKRSKASKNAAAELFSNEAEKRIPDRSDLRGEARRNGLRREMFGEKNGRSASGSARPAAPERKAPETAKVKGNTGTIPRVHTGQIPRIQTGQIPKVQTGQIPKVHTGSMPRVQTGQIPRVHTGSMPRVQTGQMPRVQTGQIPKVQTGQMPRVQSGTALKTKKEKKWIKPAAFAVLGLFLVGSAVLIFSTAGRGRKAEPVITPTDIIAGSADSAETDAAYIKADPAPYSASAGRHTVKFSVYGSPEIVCNTPDIEAGDLMDALGIDHGGDKRLSIDPAEKITGDVAIDVQKVEEITDQRTEQIPYTTEYKNDSNLYEGEEEVETYGVEGVKTFTYKCVLVNGAEESRELVSEEVTSEPVNEVIRRGTKARNQPKPVINDAPQTEYLGAPTEYLYYVDVRATCYNIVGITATGLPTGNNVMAVDPNVIPLGSKCIVIGELGSYGYRVAADIGGGIKGNIIDIWVPAGSEFGWDNCRVYVISEG